MATVLGIWIGLAGALPVLVGVTGMRRVRRLRQRGVKTWAVATPRPDGGGMMLRYTLPDGRELVKFTAARTGSLRPGQGVLIWYDPDDPADVLVYRREGRASNLVFLLVGLVFVAIGAVIGIVAP
jgi:Protein of unknown function (DUF3592)